MGRYLTILEVSQKQAYIFASNKLADNIRRSGEIAKITEIDYMQKAVNESAFVQKKPKLKDNLVYTGGGHTILEFKDENTAREVVESITCRVINDLPDIELFAATIEYDEDKKPGDNIKDLTAALEKKKSFRAASFHQGTFGIEKIDSSTGKPVRTGKTNSIWYPPEEEEPEGFTRTAKFEELGGTKNESNLIAVVHIDGNAMGKRVEQIAGKFKKGQWNDYKKKMRSFSEEIEKDYKDAFRSTEELVAESLRPVINGTETPLSALSLSVNKEGKVCLPIRRVISEGDDICFVTEGRIGLECAAAFLRYLTGKKNKEDGMPYAACAGVAIVHQKYPFYRAYELAEELCKNAKQFGVTLCTKLFGSTNGVAAGARTSAIDWHIEYGELQDTLADTRKQYNAGDGSRLELRPYIVQSTKKVLENETIRRYENFVSLMKELQKTDNYSKTRLKELRFALKKGMAETANYLKYHKIEEIGRDAYYGIYEEIDFRKTEIGSGEQLERKYYVETSDNKTRSILFDAVEMMDTFLPLQN